MRDTRETITNAAATELAIARADAVRHYRESATSKAAISDVESALQKRDTADASGNSGDKARAAQILLDARNYLAKAELQSVSEDEGVKAALLKAERAEADYQRERIEAANARAFEREQIIRNVLPGMRVANITYVLGAPATVTNFGGEDRILYQWVVSTSGKHKRTSRIVTADTKSGAVTSVTDTRFNDDDD